MIQFEYNSTMKRTDVKVPYNLADEGQEMVMVATISENNNLTKSIDEFEFSTRVYWILRTAGIRTIGQLVEKKESEILKIKNCGRKSLTELQEKLIELDLQFKQ